jgi:Rrf2 family protein
VVISQAAEYALRAVLCLAQRPGSPLTTHQIAAAARVPPGYLAKVLQGLGRAGLVRSHRGLNGGHLLAADPARVTLLDVVRAVDASRRIRTCPLDIPCHGTNLCPLHRRLDAAAAGVENALAATTIAELVAEPGESRPPCECGKDPASPAVVTVAGASLIEGGEP